MLFDFPLCDYQCVAAEPELLASHMKAPAREQARTPTGRRLNDDLGRNRLPSDAPSGFLSRRWGPTARRRYRFPRLPWAEEAPRLDRPRSVRCRRRPVGVDADRPYTRTDGLGLVPALDGCKIVTLSAEGAILEMPGGVRQSYRCKLGNRAGCWRGSWARDPLGRDAGRHRSPFSCPPFLGDFGDHVVITRYAMQQPLAPAGRDITSRLAYIAMPRSLAL